MRSLWPFWPLPRELLWALIVALAIALLVVLPSPYSQLALDVSILGIKPGEWLIGIVTWMLWYATRRLVTGADRTAERQLRAYVYIEKTTFKRTTFGGWEIIFQIKNFGQKPRLIMFGLLVLQKLSIGKTGNQIFPFRITLKRLAAWPRGAILLGSKVSLRRLLPARK
jgi:hypothetical protein